MRNLLWGHWHRMTRCCCCWHLLLQWHLLLDRVRCLLHNLVRRLLLAHMLLLGQVLLVQVMLQLLLLGIMLLLRCLVCRILLRGSVVLSSQLRVDVTRLLELLPSCWVVWLLLELLPCCCWVVRLLLELVRVRWLLELSVVRRRLLVLLPLGCVVLTGLRWRHHTLVAHLVGHALVLGPVGWWVPLVLRRGVPLVLGVALVGWTAGVLLLVRVLQLQVGVLLLVLLQVLLRVQLLLV